MNKVNKFLRLILIVSNILYIRSSPLVLEISSTCNLNDGDEKKLTNTICNAYKTHSSCASENQVERILLDQCCICFDFCCNSSSSSSSSEITDFTDIESQQSDKGTIIFPGPVHRNNDRNLETAKSRLTRIKRASIGQKVSSTSETTTMIGTRKRITSTNAAAGTGINKGNLNADITTSKSSSSVSSSLSSLDGKSIDGRTLSVIISVAVKEALNKFAHALKNATEDEQTSTTERVEASTTDPCLEFSSGASKSQVSSTKDIPKGLNCTDFDALDEFFPIKPGSNHDHGKGKKRPKRSSNNNGLPIVKTGNWNTGYFSSRNPKDILSSQDRDSKLDYFHTKDQNVQRMENPVDDPIWDTEDVSVNTGKKENHAKDSKTGSTVQPVSSSEELLKERNGKCPVLSQTCISLGPDSRNCARDGDCTGTKKCCFYGCKPNADIGVCQIPVIAY